MREAIFGGIRSTRIVQLLHECLSNADTSLISWQSWYGFRERGEIFLQRSRASLLLLLLVLFTSSPSLLYQKLYNHPPSAHTPYSAHSVTHKVTQSYIDLKVLKCRFFQHPSSPITRVLTRPAKRRGRGDLTPDPRHPDWKRMYLDTCCPL